MIPDPPRPPLHLGFSEVQAPFESPAQVARVLTEGWARKWLYCPACGHDELDAFPNNHPGSDLFCPKCREPFELKSKKGKFGTKVVDGAYRSLVARVLSDANPNFAFLSYNGADRVVRDLFVIPKQFVTPQTIEERPPLAPTARRAGWVGCNIVLRDVPDLGRVALVENGVAVHKDAVLMRWQKTLFLREVSIDARNWLLAVMACCESIGRREFELAEVYALEGSLHDLYPGNNNVRPKIRQQLQVLRDAGYLEFLGRGRYRLV